MATALRRIGPPARTRLFQIAARHQSSVPEDCDWWMVEGRLISINDTRNVRKRIDDDEQVQQINLRKSYVEKMTHISRLALGKGKEQSVYWHQYFRVYQEARDEWEKVVWDAPRRHKPVTAEKFFDAPTTKKRRKREDKDANKPFSMEEIQAAIRENIRRPPAEKNIEYRTATDTKWPF